MRRLMVLFMLWPGMAIAQPFPVLQDCPQCPEVVLVPMASGALAMGRTEVTFAQYDACVAAGACTHVPLDHGWGRGDRPVMNLPLSVMETYLAWLSQKTGKIYRLPTEAEWDHAAQAGTTTAYPWGDHVGKGNANCRKCGVPEGGDRSRVVATLPPNPWGLHDMNGNVWELTATCWRSDPASGEAGDCTYRTARGGAWYYIPALSKTASRTRFRVGDASYTLGFRVVREDGLTPSD